MDLPLDSIICGDCLQSLRELPDNSIDLIITSPPYNIRHTMKKDPKTRGPNDKGNWKNADLIIKGYDNYKDDLDPREYVRWQQDILKECFRVIKDDGAIFYNHKYKINNGLLIDHSDILQGLPVRQIIIWKRAGNPFFHDTFFLQVYEVIYMIAKPKFRLIPHANAVGDVWDIPQEANTPHPAPFPVEIPRRIIQSTSADVVLDPFMGSGSTGVAAKQLGRHYIGFELSPKYCEMARERIRKTTKPIKNWFYADE